MAGRVAGTVGGTVGDTVGGSTPYPEGWASPQLCGAEISNLLKSIFLYETFQFFNIENKILKTTKNTVWAARLILACGHPQLPLVYFEP